MHLNSDIHLKYNYDQLFSYKCIVKFIDYRNWYPIASFVSLTEHRLYHRYDTDCCVHSVSMNAARVGV